LSNNISIPRLLFIFITAVLITSIFSIPATKSQPLQSSATDVSQIVNQIADRVAAANAGIEVIFVEQILTELARQSSQVSSQGNTLEEIHSQVLTYHTVLNLNH
jgi:hypothetical protein